MATESGIERHEAGSQAAPSAASVSLLVVNHRARSGNSDLEAAIDALGSGGRAPVTLEIDDPSTLSQRIREMLSPDVGRVVIAGGDGTINSALPALVESGTPLGIIPLGTANDLARTLGIPTDPEEAVAVVNAGRLRRIDVGNVNGHLFLNAAGIGFSTELQRLPHRFKSVLGPLAYPLGVLRRWKQHRSFRAYVRGDGVAGVHRVIQVTVANGRYYGGGMTARQEASIDDGVLDVLLILHRPLWQLAASAISLKRGVYSKHAPIVALCGKSFEISTRKSKPVATDGEATTSTPASFSIAPRALQVFVPDVSA